MEPNPEVLLNYVKKNAVDSQAVAFLKFQLAPFAEAAEKGYYPFFSQGTMDEELMAKAIMMMCGVPVEEIAYFSIGAPITAQSWQTPRAHKKFMKNLEWREVVNSLAQSVGEGIPSILETRFGTEFQEEDTSELRTVFRQALGMSLNKAFRESLPAHHQTVDHFFMWQTINSILISATYYALRADWEKLNAVVPMVKAIQQGLPLGHRVDRTGMWVVACA